MPLGEWLAEGLFRLLFQIIFEVFAYGTGFVILYPFTGGRVRKWDETTVSLVGIGFWIVVGVLGYFIG